MTEEHPNALVARRLWSAVAEGNAEVLREVLAPDVVWRVMGHHRLAGDYHGPDKVIDYLATIGETADRLVTILDSIFVDEVGTVLAYHVSAVREERRLEMDFLLRLRVANDRIATAISVPLDQKTNDAFWG